MVFVIVRHPGGPKFQAPAPELPAPELPSIMTCCTAAFVGQQKGAATGVAAPWSAPPYADLAGLEMDAYPLRRKYRNQPGTGSGWPAWRERGP